MRTIIIWCIVGAAIGWMLGMAGVQIPDWAAVGIVIALVVVIVGYHAYVLFWTKNIQIVEAYLKKRKKQPYYALMLALANGDLEKAERYAEQLTGKYEEARKSALANIQIEKNQLEEAADIANEIKNDTVRYYNQALVALMQGKEEQFAQAKNNVANRVLRYVLEAEKAFRQGDKKEAEQLGHLAISSARGLQKYVLVRSLERQQKNPNRHSFF